MFERRRCSSEGEGEDRDHLSLDNQRLSCIFNNRILILTPGEGVIGMRFGQQSNFEVCMHFKTIDRIESQARN